MKKTLKLALACTLGAAFVFVGCTKDYSSDISKLDTRVSAIEKENVATRLTALENADAQFTEQLKSVDAAITLTNTKIEEALAASKDYTDEQVKLLKTQIATLATKEELQNAKADLQGKIDEINGKLNLTITVGEKTYTFETVAALSVWLTNYSMSYTTYMVEQLAIAVNEALNYLDARIDTTNWRIDTVNVKLAELTEIVNQKEQALSERIEAVKGDLATLDAEVDKFINETFSAYKAEMKNTIDGINSKIADIEKELGIVNGKINSISGRITGIAAKAPVGDGNVEATQFLFGDIDKTRIEMSFNVTGPADNITSENSVLVITEGESRTKAAVEDDCTEYKFYGDPVISGKVVTVVSFVQTKLNAENRYWATLKYNGVDEAGTYTIASAPVEVLEGDPIDLRDPSNLVWYKGDKKVTEQDLVAYEKDYQCEDSEGYAPSLYTEINAVDFFEIFAKGQSKEFENVLNGYYIRVKTANGDKSLSELQKLFDLKDSEIALTAGEPSQLVYKQSDTYRENVAPTVTFDGKPLNDIFVYTTEALGDVDVAVAYPDKYYVGDQTIANRWIPVGAASEFTIPTIKIGGVAYPGLDATVRVWLKGHKEVQKTKITNFKPFIEWDYLNCDVTRALEGNSLSNGAFYGYDLAGDAIMQIIAMFKGKVANEPANTNITYKTLSSEQRVDLFIDYVAVSAEDQELTAVWKDSNIDVCEPTGVKVCEVVYSAELPFTVEARHADVPASEYSKTFIPNQAKDDVIALGSIVDNKFTDAEANWVGALAGIKDIDDVKAAYADAIAAAQVDLEIEGEDVEESDFSLNTATGELTIKAGALDYEKTYVLTYSWTVFGVKFSDVITLNTILPEYALKTRDLYVPGGVVTLEGQLDDYDFTGIGIRYLNPLNAKAYFIEEGHFNKYVFVEKFDKSVASGEDLKVVFDVAESLVAVHHAKTQHIVAAENVPTDGVLEGDPTICWNKGLWSGYDQSWKDHGKYIGESTTVTATLYANGRKVNAVTFTVKRVDPITVAESYDINVNKTSAEDVTVNALYGLSVIGTLPYDETEQTVELWDNDNCFWDITLGNTHYNYGQENNYSKFPKITPKNIEVDWDNYTSSATLYEGQDYTIKGNTITFLKDNAPVEFTMTVPVIINLNYGEYKTNAVIKVKQGSSASNPNLNPSGEVEE